MTTREFQNSIVSMFMFSAAIVLISPFAALAGGIAGWTVGLVFGDIVLRFMSQIGICGMSMWEIGIACGFLGSFLRTRVSHKDGDKKDGNQ